MTYSTYCPCLFGAIWCLQFDGPGLQGSGGAGFIGQKGIGFKSVFTVCGNYDIVLGPLLTPFVQLYAIPRVSCNMLHKVLMLIGC